MTTPAKEEEEEEEEQSEVAEYEIDSVVPKNVDHLLDDPLEFVCPACQQKSTTRVLREAVTFVQRLVAVVNCCLCCSPIKWSGRHDVNHYCGKCGCYIGRKITLSWYKRQLFRMQNSGVETSSRWQHFRKVEKESLDKKKLKHSANNNDTAEPHDEHEQQQ